MTEAVQEKTPAYQPDFLKDKSFVLQVQELAFRGIRGYYTEHEKGASLMDVYGRVQEIIRRMKLDGELDIKFYIPGGKRTVDRRVNEIASLNPKENLLMRNGVPLVKAVKARNGNRYWPNPLLFEDVKLEGQ